MDLNTLFIFGSNFSQVPVCVSNEKLDWETNCRIVKGDYAGIELPIVFKQISGKKWTDVLNPNSVSMYIISQRFIELLEKNDITGWESYPIIIFDKEEKKVSGYVGFSVIGRSGAVDYTKSEIFEKQLVPNGSKSKYYKGLYVGLDKWDGSDFFIPEDTLDIITTEKVMQIIRKYKISNVVLQSLANFEISEYALLKNTSV
jgi:hypothetical protein